MIATLRNRNFALLWLAGLISFTGNWMLLVALPFHVYSITGSALATSGLLMAYIAPGALFGSVAGVFVDRWDRKRTMILVSVAQAAVIPLLMLVRTSEWVWVVYVVMFVESSLGQFFGPAENALLPSLVGEEHLMSANSLNALNDNLARMIGPAIGGVLLGFAGLTSVILFDAVTYVMAAVLITIVVAPASVKSEAAPAAVRATSKWIQVWREWVAGLKLVKQDRVLSSAFLVIGIALFGDAILSVIMVVFVQDTMGLEAVEFGWMMTARGLGGILGGLIIAQLGRKLSPRQLITWGLLATGAILFVAISIPVLYVVLPLMVLVGIPLIAWIVSVQTIFQQATEDAYRGRVFGAFGTTNTLLMLIGSGLAGGLTDLLGDVILMLAAAVIYILAGVISWLTLTKPMEQIPATS
jgi:MFS family permease